MFESILGNVGRVLAFRMGALDAPTIAAQIRGVTTADFVGLPNHYADAKVVVDGEKGAVSTVDKSNILRNFRGLAVGVKDLGTFSAGA